MYPLKEDKLDLLKLSELWARVLEGSPPQQEVVDHLLKAIWRGQLKITLRETDGREENTKSLLDMMLLIEDHPGVLFITSGETPPPITIEHPDGSLDVDLRKRIFLPEVEFSAESDFWKACFKEISSLTFDAYSPLIKPKLASLSFTKENFRHFCLTQKYPLPAFWFEQQPPQLTNVKDESACRDWLKTELIKYAATKTKEEWLKLAREKFNKLSHRAFYRVWDEVAPESSRKAGRRRKKS